jgi:hypothetical protein
MSSLTINTGGGVPFNTREVISMPAVAQFPAVVQEALEHFAPGNAAKSPRITLSSVMFVAKNKKASVVEKELYE